MQRFSSLHQQNSQRRLEEVQCRASTLTWGGGRERGQTSPSLEDPPVADAAPVGCSGSCFGPLLLQGLGSLGLGCYSLVLSCKTTEIGLLEPHLFQG